MIKLIKCFLVFAILGNGLSGCASTKETADLQQAQIEREKVQQELQQKQAQIIEKVDQLAVSVQQWQEVQPGVTRLVAIEKELNSLISQLNTIVVEAEKEKVQAAKQKKASPKKKQKPAQVAKRAPTPVVNKGTFYALQLISVGSVKTVEKSWSDIYNKNAKILAGQQPLIEKVLVKNKTYYRIKAGKFSEKSAAQKICKQLKQQKVGCLVSPYAGQTLPQFKAANSL